MTAFKIAAKWIAILCLPLVLFTGTIALAANSAWLYQYGFDKYQVNETTGITKPELDKAADGLIHYFNSDEEYINLTVSKDNQPFQLFNEREIDHLKDVKSLIWLDYRVLLGTLIVVLGYAISMVSRRDRRQLAWAGIGGGALTLAIMAFMGIYALIDFNGLFINFHLLSFTNDLWQLNPATDYLIMLFPEGFWFDAFLYIAAFIGVSAVAILSTGIAYLKRHREDADL